MSTYTILGKKVGVIGYGLMGLTARATPLSNEAKFAAIKAALDAGCNYLNAAEFYGPPDNNSLTLLHAYFTKYPEDAAKVVLNVKGAMSLPNLTPAADKDSVTKSIDGVLGSLAPGARVHQYAAARKDTKVDYEEETLATIDSYVKAGKIDGISCSEVNASTIRSAAKKYKITAVEIEFSLFTSEPLTNGVLEACGELDIPVLAYSPLGKGLLSGQIKTPEDLPEDDMRRHYPRYQGENFYKNLELVPKIEALAQKKGCTPGQIAINWLLAVAKRPGMPRIIPIPGSSNVDRIRENATVIDLTDADLAEIDQMVASFVPAGDRYPQAFMTDLSL